MPSHNFKITSDDGLHPHEDVLRLLLALTIKNGGELRIKGTLFDTLDRGRLLLIDFDRKKNEIVLRSTSDFGRVAVVRAEGQVWSAPPESAPMERARIAAAHAAEERSLPTDEQLAEMEEKLAVQKRVADDVAAGLAPMRIHVKK